MDENKDKIFDEIQRRTWYEIPKECLDWLWDIGFFTAPASAKHHGNYVGGLYEHSKNVAIALENLTDRLGLEWERRDSPYIIGLLHDVCKVDQYVVTGYLTENMPRYDFNPDTLYKGHGEKSVLLLTPHISLTEEEVACITYHMGAFTNSAEWDNYTGAIHRYPNVLYTHTADMIATHIMEVKICNEKVQT